MIPLIDTLGTDELLDMKSELEAVIRQRKEEDRKAVLKQIRAIAAEVGYTLEDLLAKDVTGKKASNKHKAGVPKYRNPDNPSQTWTGKGHRPRWFVAAQLRGLNPEQLMIQ